MKRNVLPFVVLALAWHSTWGFAQSVPHGQDRPPNPPRSPEEAVRAMTVPPGFQVELVASEPDLVNPVAMTFDERGRIWVTESLEYPRRSAGPGRDRVKILEDTDGDGRVDKTTVFADGLNIPSGIAVGYGGVWVANAPDILFLQDRDGDDHADTTEVVVSGFGRHDTHELPNSLTWGPDGWLYGLNGVFNPAHIEHRGEHYDFTCALFRINPRADAEGPWQGTREFQLFCEGTSNPWGVAFDTEGSAFISACVIDHLWHLTETGYYHRQGGPYPPFTWKMESIVDHQHQKRAYCGIHYFDSEAYPAEYRERLYMGNIHGGCINVDQLSRNGSTYLGEGRADFLTANDAWFMPVVQKTGPDGCLYVLDWYDRYHCYQDANRDPQGIDRVKGRLYRVRYEKTPRAAPFDLRRETDDQLIQRLSSPNVFYRDLAQRLLAERGSGTLQSKLAAVVFNDTGIASRKARLHALWAVIGGGPMEIEFLNRLLQHDDATFRAWGVRAAGNQQVQDPELCRQIGALSADPSADVQLQVAIAAGKLERVGTLPTLLDVLGRCGDDPLIPQIVWQNLHPLLESHSGELLDRLSDADSATPENLANLMPRIIERVLAIEKPDPAAFAMLFGVLTRGPTADRQAAAKCLAILAERIQSRQVSAEQLAELRPRLESHLQPILGGDRDDPLYLDAALLATSWRDSHAVESVRQVARSPSSPPQRRVQALSALITAEDAGVVRLVESLLQPSIENSVGLRAAVLAALGRAKNEDLATVVLAAYDRMEPELQPRAIELLTQRTTWSRELLDAVHAERLSANALNVNQIRKLLASPDADLVAAARAQWGTVRSERNPDRERLIAEMKRKLRPQEGDPNKGHDVFMKVCAQCHKIYGQGEEVGPDLSGNGRGSYDQLLSNVFDPSLVIGPSYQARTLITADGRVLTGLLVEDNQQRIVLKIQGGKLETIPREDIEQMKVSKLSMMPENLEQQVKEDELLDLFAFLALDKPPGDPQARWIPGTVAPRPQVVEDPQRYGELLQQILPGFATRRSGEGGIGLLPEHRGRSWVIRTHPVDRETPCVLSGEIAVPAGRKTYLLVSVSHDPRGDWQLDVRVKGKSLQRRVIGPASTLQGWADVRVDLSAYAGQRVRVDLENRATGWSWEFGYWQRIEAISE